MDWTALIDAQSALLVIGGTLFATILRSGRAELAATGRMLGQMFRPKFDFQKARSEIAPDVAAMCRDGILRAPPSHSSDAEFLDATDTLVRHRSVAAMIAAHRSHKAKRQQIRTRAVWTLSQAGELAPVFGMAGTLFALSQIPSGTMAADGLFAAVATAIVTTLYGLLTAHLMFFPLARWVARRGQEEEEARELLIQWLAEQVANICPAGQSKARHAA